MILSRDQITITDLHDGVDGDTYALNIIGGTRSVTYNTSGSSPSPAQTAFSFELLKNAVPVTPTSIAWSVTGHLTGTGTSAVFTPGIALTYSTGKTDSVSLTVVYNNISFKETVPISITKLNAGIDAKIITLNPSGLVFKQDKGGTVTPASITLTSQAQNTSVSTWSYSVNGAAFTTTKPTWLTAPSSGVLTVTNANMKNNNITSLAVKVADSSGVYFDTVTLVRAIDGSDGSNGLNGAAPITGYLTNESITLSATNAGVVSDLPISGISEFKILDGITEVSPTSVGYSLVQGSLVGGAAASINSSGSISLGALTSDNGSAQFAATYKGQTIKKTISFAKSKQGVVGPEGPAGRAITSVDVWYYLSTSSTSLAGGRWSTTAPTWVDGRFMWSKTITTYSTGSPTESTPVCITGAKGATGSTGGTGATGRGVSSIVEEFYLSTSKTTQTGGNWSTTAPTWAPGKYVWTRSKITYTSGTPATDTTTPLVSSEWEAVNEVQVGGRNLLIDFSMLDGWINNTGILTGGAPYKTTLYIELELGKDYIYQMWNKSTEASWWTAVYFDEENQYKGGYISQYLPVGYTQKIINTDNYPGSTKIRVSYHHMEGITQKLEKGNKATDWTAAPEDDQKLIAEVINTITEEYTSDISLESSRIKSYVSENYYDKAKSDELLGALETEFIQTSSTFEFNFEETTKRINSVETGANAEFEKIRDHIRFDKGDIIIGTSENAIKLVMENNQVSFYNGEKRLSYWQVDPTGDTPPRFYVEDGEFINSLVLGNFSFKPGLNGNLSFGKER